MTPESRFIALTTGCLAFALCSSPVRAATADWWRFESSPGFLADSIGSTALSAVADAHAVVLPASGRGSTFPHGFTPSGGNPNLRAAEFDGSADVLSAPFSFPAGDLTIECFVHMDAMPATSISTLVAYSDPTNPTTGNSWTLQVRYDSMAGTQPRELTFGGYTGSFPSPGFLFFGSGIILTFGKDYYIAVSFDQASPSVVTFYVKNLTDNGPLQVVVKTATSLAFIPATTLSIGALPAGNTPLDGLVDEVRLSTHVVLPADLLINQIGPPVPFLSGVTRILLGFALGFVALGLSAASATRGTAALRR